MRPTCLFTPVLALSALLNSFQTISAEESLSYADLVHRMTSLERLAVLPAPGEKCTQCSSYDRASKYDETTGKYQAWDANGDGGGIIRREGNKVVMAEMEGPGCIWRIWSADAKQGHVRIYLDGQETPAVDLPFAKYFSGDTAPFAYPALSYNLNHKGCSGQNLYFPIPFQKSCKVVADEGWGNYYHFTFDTFPKGTKVPTFTPALAVDNAVALKQVNEYFEKRLGEDPAGHRPSEQTVSKNVQAAPGQTVQVCELAGPEAITAIRVKTQFKDRADQMAGLRKLTIRMTWDNQAKPAVWCPLGDFFGTAPGENLYKSLPTGMTKDGYYALWYMPFAQKAVVELANEDQVAREVQFEIVHAPLGRPFDGLGHFHAKWHRDTVALSKDRFPDWIMLRTEGRGRFCGVMLHVWNPWGGWWGEGDEKFFVDGEKFPSTIGTGSEDYFGYAWCTPGLVQQAYHCQTMTQNNEGHQSVLRWHILDNIPFQTGFEGCIEKYFTNEANGTLFACLPVWYLAPGGIDAYEPLPVEQRHDYYVKPLRTAGGFKILGCTAGQTETQNLSEKWRNNDQLWWTGAGPGAKLDIVVPVEKAGKYRLSAVLTKASDYGIVQLYLDGKKMSQPVDLYNADVAPTDPPVELGIHELSAGEHKLTVEITGANAAAKKSYLFGLDYLNIDPVQ